MRLKLRTPRGLDWSPLQLEVFNRFGVAHASTCVGINYNS
jgi:hypothetical protein